MRDMNDRLDTAAERYPHVFKTLFEQPWAILPQKLAAITEMVLLRASGERFSREELEARIGKPSARRDDYRVGTVAVLPIHGVIAPKADIFTEVSGGTSVQRLQDMLESALSDEDVSAIALDVDSPGGSVELITELAGAIRAGRERKPIIASANSRAASAAYWLASQASEIVVTPSGDVGSIGVFAAHEDVSALQEKLGVKTTLISAGEFKTEGNPFEPLSDDARAYWQGLVDETYAVFVDDVSRGRGVSAETVRERYGKGRMLRAPQALASGMVDRIETIDATISRLAGRRVDLPAPPGAVVDGFMDEEGDAVGVPTFADDVDTAHRALERVVNRAEALRALTGAKQAQLAALAERASALASQASQASEPSAELEDLEIDHALIEHASRLRGAAS